MITHSRIGIHAVARHTLLGLLATLGACADDKDPAAGKPSGGNGAVGAFQGAYETRDPNGNLIECTNYYGEAAAGAKPVYNRTTPCPAEKAWGACEIRPDSVAPDVHAEGVYYDFMGPSEDPNDYSNLEEGDTCNTDGVWRDDYDGTPPTTIPEPAPPPDVSGGFFSCNEPGFHKCTEWMLTDATAQTATASNCQRLSGIVSTDPCPTDLLQYTCDSMQEPYGGSIRYEYATERPDGVVVPLSGLDIAEQTCGKLGGTYTQHELRDSVPKGEHLSGVTQLVAYDRYACALRDDGTVKCWGSFGLAGGSEPDLSGLTDITFVAVGLQSACAVKDADRVFCWGRDDSGQLGNGSASATPVTVPVEVPDVSGALSVAVGGDHVCALLEGGKVSCWGKHVGNGDASSSPPVVGATEVDGLKNVVEVSTAGTQTCALLKDGVVHCWGPSGPANATDAASPVLVEGLTGVESISCGPATCALLADGTVQCWNSTLANSPSIVTEQPPVPGPDAVVEGVQGATGLTQGGVGGAIVDGTVALWYYNGPVVTPWLAWTVPYAHGLTQLAVGGDFYCGLLPDTSVVCWGKNDMGQLGGATVPDSSTPAYVLP